MIASNHSSSTLFVAAKVFGNLKMLSFSAAHFSLDLQTFSSGSSSGVQAQWSFVQDDPERSFLLALLMDQAELSVNFTVRGFITVLRPQKSLPFLLNIKVNDEDGHISHQTINIAFCQSVHPPVSASIQMLDDFEFDLRFGAILTNNADVIGYEIMCSWPDTLPVYFCTCSQCKPSTLLVSLPSSQSQTITVRLSHNAKSVPSVFIRTLGFAGHSEFVQVVSVIPGHNRVSSCSDSKHGVALQGAFFDQDSGSVMVRLHSALVNYSANVEVSFSTTSG
jgi:hypothetical protein